MHRHWQLSARNGAKGEQMVRPCAKVHSGSLRVCCASRPFLRVPVRQQMPVNLNIQQLHICAPPIQPTGSADFFDRRPPVAEVESSSTYGCRLIVLCYFEPLFNRNSQNTNLYVLSALVFGKMVGQKKGRLSAPRLWSATDSRRAVGL